MASELAVQTHVLQVLLHVHLGEGTLVGTLAHGDLLIDKLHVLQEPNLAQLSLRHERVALIAESLPGHLVQVLLVLLVILTRAGEALDRALDLDHVTLGIHAVDGHRQLCDPLLLLGEHHGHLLGGLPVFSVLVTPADVLVGGLGQMLLDVVERVLGDVSHTCVGMLPDGSLGGDHLAGEQLDHGRLASAVDSDAGHAGGQGHLDGHVGDGGLLVDGVGELALDHLHERLTLGLHSLDETGLGEVEGELGGLQLEVCLGVGVLRHEVGQVTLGGVQLEILDLHDVRAALVEQLGVVGHDHGGHFLQGGDVVHGPLHVEHVQVVGGLVHKQDVGPLEHSAGQRELHAPATGQEGHGLLDHSLGETDGGKHRLDVLAGDRRSLDLLIVVDVVDAGQVGQIADDVSLDEHGAELGGGGETLNLLVGNGAHERGLAGVVTAEQPVAEPAKQLHLSVVQQDLRAVRERELAVAQLLGVLLLLDVSLGGQVNDALVEDRLEALLHLGLGPERRQVLDRVRVPLRDIVLVRVAQRADDARREVDRLGHVGVHIATDVLGDMGSDEGVVRLLALVGLHLHLDPLELHVGLVAHIAGLGVGDLDASFVQSGQQLGQEGSRLHGVIDELGHVGDNLSALALDGGLLLLETASEQRHNDSQGGALDGLHEGARCERVDGLGDERDVRHRSDDIRDHLLDILVVDSDAGLVHGRPRHGLHRIGDVNHASGHDGHDLRQALRHLRRGGFGQLRKHGESAHHGPGAVGAVHGGQKHRHDGLGRVRRHAGNRSGASKLRGGAYRLLLVRVQLQHGAEHGHDVGVAGDADVLADSNEGFECSGALGGLLLVAVLHSGDQLLDGVVIEALHGVCFDESAKLRDGHLGGIGAV
mmetsp:Transcript_40297/g.67542  ORF Transcript_40297/g.67542 Transcript_40297/m.67542 type:complete len:875 (+) Transcript_40297:1075-3699(+)